MNFSIQPCKFGYASIVTTDGLLCGLELFGTKELAIQTASLRFLNVKTLKTYDDRNEDPGIQEILQSINENIEYKKPIFFLTGTNFQKKVWEELLKVPTGKTISYKDIATNIGHPNAVRAVGTACGANPIAIIVPCHRAVRSNGKSSGYRWGIEIKNKLLVREFINPFHQKDYLVP